MTFVYIYLHGSPVGVHERRGEVDGRLVEQPVEAEVRGAEQLVVEEAVEAEHLQLHLLRAVEGAGDRPRKDLAKRFFSRLAND